jgi:DNA (cytosine-5)-methyltransferase 1
MIVPVKNPNPNLTFIDLFAGIGGFRIALENAGAKCVFSSEYDKYACQTYFANFGEMPKGDINFIESEEIPNFDILCGGFPCQPFSIAGVVKKNSLGKKHGFEDEKQGNLFFEVARIIDHHKPKAFFLENVKNLKSHDKGNTFNIIHNTLTSLGYNVFYQIMDAKYFVPQHRERIFIIGLKKSLFPDTEFIFPEYPANREYELKDIIHPSQDPKYTLTDKLWNYLYQRKIDNKLKGKGFGYGLIDINKDEYTRTISARYYKDGSEILIHQPNSNPRRLSPQECLKIQGFPDNFKIVVSDNQAYKQFGNSVCVPLISAVANRLVQTLESPELIYNFNYLRTCQQPIIF